MPKRGSIWQHDESKKFGISHTDEPPTDYPFDTKAQAESEVTRIFTAAQSVEHSTSGVGAQGHGELHSFARTKL